MGGHHHTAGHTLGPYRDLRTIVEAAHHLTFRTLLELIWRKVQTRLNERVVEHGVLFAAGHKHEASEIGEDSPCAILAVEPQQGARLRKLVRGEVARDRRKSLAQLRAVAPVAAVAKTAEPLEAMSLTDDGPRPHHLPALAPPVAWGTNIIQSAKSGRQVFALG